ncbi:uncharacterized protein LOC117651160, partial [Thrips palmi]|uniref:Uncharacterized protein LOC117651160 n=1 Tax=Thrips palmi TaxID=161013 RepID=A0A6P9A233_THRPL
RVVPINEPDSEVEVFGYRYPLPPPVGLAPGPSVTAPFWEAAWLRRRERLLQELGLAGLAGQQGPCRCAPLSEVCGYPAYPGFGPPFGYLARYRPDGVTDADLPYRLGVGAYGLYGGGRPLHHHNTAPLGTARLHDNPN